MAVIRSFIAVDLPDEIHSHLQKIIQSLSKGIPLHAVRWVAVKNIHLTLMFLGDVPVASLPLLKENLTSELVSYSQCVMKIADLGAFPSVQRPSVIWVGVEYDQTLKDIWSGIQSRMSKLDFPRDNRPFAPHLTIGRINRKATREEIHRISQEILQNKEVRLGSVTISAVHLYQSELKTGGSVYSKLHTIKLGT